MPQKKYLHGFSRTEQDRLVRQAKMLEPYVFEDVNYKNCKHIIEVGSGVGAQTEILLKKFPKLKITCVDLSEEQISYAKQRLKKYIEKGRVRIIHLNAERLEEIDQKFDGAFICWFLEHVPSPLNILKSLKKVLKKNAPVHIIEGQNAGFFINPYCPTILKFSYEFNDYLWENSGNPYIGANLGNLLKQAGFKTSWLHPRTVHVDDVNKSKLRAFLDDFRDLMITGSENLIQAGKITEHDLEKCLSEFSDARKSENFVYEWAYISVLARR